MTLIALFALAACTPDQGFHDLASGTEPAPAIEVAPSTLVFGQVEDGGAETRSFEVRSVGDAPLVLDGVQVAEGQGSYTLLSGDPAASLEPGAVATFEVSFAPNSLDHPGRILVTSNAPEGESWLELAGQGLTPWLEIDPNPLTLPTTDPGCEQSGEVRLRNAGTEPLTITAVALGAGPFELVTTPWLPVTLEPGKFLPVDVRFQPDSLGAFVGQIWVESDTPAGSTAGGLEGKGAPSETFSKEWVQPDGPWSRADFLFFLDSSCSMEDNIQSITANFSYFISAVGAEVDDWQVTVSSQADGCHAGDIVTPESPDAFIEFANAVWHTLNSVTSEKGLHGSANAVEEAVAGCNAGMIRDDSKLAVLIVSDEPDQSSDTWSSYVQRMQAVVPNATVHAIAGPVPDGCGGSDGVGRADPGYGYEEATLATGGQFLSICDPDWASKMNLVAQSVGEPWDTFTLDGEPEPGSVQVFLDGIESTEGWSYVPSAVAVVFEPWAVPPGKSRVTVTWGEVQPCSPGT